MVNKKVKIICLGIGISIMLASTSVFAKTNTISNTGDTSKIFNKNVQPSDGVKVQKSNVSYVHYTYANAPANVKADYEDDCKAVNKAPCPSDKIAVPIRNKLPSQFANMTASGNNDLYLEYNKRLGYLMAIDETTQHTYIADVIGDVVGYGHQTQDVHGDQAVTCLQSLLNHLGYNLEVDGYFGPKTQNAVLDFQDKHGLSRDGITGPLTWQAMLKAALLV